MRFLESLQRKTDGWCDSEEEANAIRARNGALIDPMQDPVTGKWCADPELGLSCFAFWDKRTFHIAVSHVMEYAIDDLHGIGVFTSDDFKLGVGADGEDVFRNGTFIGRLPLLKRFFGSGKYPRAKAEGEVASL